MSIQTGKSIPLSKFQPGIATNGYNSSPNGGTLSLSNSSLSSSGDGNFGIVTANTGVTTLTNDTISQSGANSGGVASTFGGQTTINGGTTITSTGRTARASELITAVRSR